MEAFEPLLPNILPEKVLVEKYKISRTTLWRFRETGKIACYKIGRRVFYSVEHIRELLASCEKTSTNNKRLPRYLSK